jgi:hypothetical protein
MMRLKQVYGPGNPIPVGKTKFFLDIVYHEGRDEYVPGTTIKRLRLAKLGDRTPVAFEDEVFALAEAIRKQRDAKLDNAAWEPLGVTMDAILDDSEA